MTNYGRGSVYRPTYTYKGEKRESATWWIRYSMDGKDHRESSGSTVKADAIDLLNQRIAESPKEAAKRAREGTLTFVDLAAGLRLDYDLKGRKSKSRMEQSLKHLKEAFGGWFAADIDARAIKSYAAARKRTAQPATVNREIAALKRAFRIAADDGLVDSVPAMPRLKEDNVRTGFFEPNQYRDVRAALPEYLRPLIDVAYHTGWRQGELLSRTWAHVDFDAGWIRLEPGETKNGKGRQFPLIAPVREALETQRDRKLAIERRDGRIVQPVFFGDDGERISRFVLYDAWKKATKGAGHPELLFHDLRRTAVRNSTRAGITRSVAKQLSGHLTDSVFNRYDIVDENDLLDAGEKLEARLNPQRTRKEGTGR
jgi:integrase